MNEQKQEGILVRWHPENLYGFVGCETIDATGIIKGRFFLHWSRVTYCERGTGPQIGDRVLFIASNAPPKAGKAKFIVEAEIYNSVEALRSEEAVQHD